MEHSPKHYNFSFTAGAALLQETVTIAQTLLETNFDWDKTKQEINNNNLLQKDKRQTSTRQFSLVKFRLEQLSKQQIKMLCSESMPDKKIMVILSIIKSHPLVFDFIAETIRSKYFAFDYKLTYADYNAFINEKQAEHPELNSITEGTGKKIRQMVFKILEQTELIDSVKSGTIKKPYVSPQLEQVIVKDNPFLLAALLYNNEEIILATQKHHA
ncbi:MAG: DUF1819 family protein [Bacteroides graminisolvens]|jgi:hypothetical protein|nr:DUF1819 family protein [Bacteroides graminisolvens]